MSRAMFSFRMKNGTRIGIGSGVGKGGQDEVRSLAIFEPKEGQVKTNLVYNQRDLTLEELEQLQKEVHEFLEGLKQYAKKG